jgi:hypothetical protein
LRKKHAQGVIWRAMWRAHGRSFLVSGLVKLAHDVVMFAGPVLLELLLKHVQARWVLDREADS